MSKPIVIAIDGPSGAGKGAVTHALAIKTGFHILDSGALYRLVGLAARRDGIDLDREEHIADVAAHLEVEFLPASSGPEPFQVLLRGQEVTDEIRTDAAGVDASRVASMPSVRDGLAQLQRGFRKAPGLIADGRDMGTVIFTDAAVKIFLTASAEVRAERRYKQLKNKGMDVSLAALLQSIRERDARDASRPVAPLKPAEDAIILDSSALSLDAVHKAVWEVVEQNVSLGANSFAE